MYFKNIPKTLYPFSINGPDEFIAVKDITVNVRFVKEVLSNITLYDEYDIVDGETPEIISEKVYGTPHYHWVIMLVNERFDYINDFPVTYNVLQEIAKKKYGSNNLNNIHHYELNGFIVNTAEDLANPNVKSVTNIEYEEIENEKKRRIKLIDSRLIASIVTEYNKALTR